MKRVIYHASMCVTVLLLIAGFAAPAAYVVNSPGPLTDVLGKIGDNEVIDIKGKEGFESSGMMYFTTVRVYGGPGKYMSIGNLVAAYFQTANAIYPLEYLYPVNASRQDVDETNSASMIESEDSAITAVRNLLNEHEVSISINTQSVGGPSAGLMFALGIYNKLTGDSLAQNRVIAGTGTISDEGDVGRIGGINQKVQSAKNFGAQIFVMPRGNCLDLSNASFDGIQMVAVNNLSEAIDALLNGSDSNKYSCSFVG